MGDKIKKIAIFSGIFHPESGGPATYLYKLCNSLSEKGYSISLLCFGEDPIPSPSPAAQGKGAEYPYSVKRISRKWPVLLRLIIYFFRVFITTRGADLLFVSDYGLPVALANIFMKKKSIIKIVGDFAWEKSVRDGLTTDSIDDFQIKKQCWRSRLLKRIQKYYVSKMDQVVTPSKYLKKVIMGWGIDQEKIEVVYNAVDLSPGLRRPLSANAEKGAQNKKILITVARLVPWKGIDKVISVMPQLKTQFENIEYWVIGDGPDLKRLQNLAKENNVAKEVKFLGKISNEKVFDYMKKADLFILYSGYEGLPHVILEAMSIGLPSLVSSCGGNPEVVDIGKCGRVCSDDDQLPIKIIELLQNPLVINKIPLQFSWANLLEQYLELING